MAPFDVLVIGAGPAGCAAAIRCASAGARVGLVDAQTSPRERPGETLHPGVEPLFDQLGIGDAVRAAGFIRHGGVRVRVGSGPWREQAYGADERGPWLGFQAPGVILDQLFLDRTCEAGAVLIRPARALAPCVRNGRVDGVETSAGTLRARWVLDGTGSRQWLTRSLGVEVTHHSPRRIVCYGYAEGEFPGDSWPELHCTTSGWTWRAVISSSRLAWARLSFAKNSKLLAPPSELFGAGKPIGAIRAADATWRIAKTLAGPGWLLLGDAAAQLDPAAGHGVLRALMSGIMAAHLILKASPEDAALAYDQWLRAWFAEDVTRLNQLYREMHASEFEPHPSVGSLTSNIETPQPPHETQRLCSQVNI